jgi:tetratricopeptide (TPR) repeat protein
MKELKRYDQAIEHYNKAISDEFNNDKVSTLNNKGLTLVEQEKYLEAITCYD